MSVIAFVPARGGSKSIPNKNIKLFCNKPLIFWVLHQLQESLVDEIVVATDCLQIKHIVKSFNFNKVKIYNRKPENATDFSTTESVILEYINSVNLTEHDIIMLVQLTSPFTRAFHFNEGLKLFEKYDSVLSCCISKRYSWDKQGIPLNYDVNNRPRRQDHEGTLIENGAFYISSVLSIKNSKIRISGNIGVYEMPEYTYTEIDEIFDWIAAESIMQHYVLKNNRNNFQEIKIFLSDVDGVLTDGGMYYTESGDEFKKFSAYDGMAFQLLQKNGIKVGIITSEDRDINRNRAKKLGLDYHFHGIKDKLSIVKKLSIKEGVSLKNIAYIGDDINCFELLNKVGLSACPNNAVKKIKLIPGILQLSKKGGDGVVRELADKILK